MATSATVNLCGSCIEEKKKDVIKHEGEQRSSGRVRTKSEESQNHEMIMERKCRRKKLGKLATLYQKKKKKTFLYN